jgi:hypothetical protein
MAQIDSKLQVSIACVYNLKPAIRKIEGILFIAANEDGLSDVDQTLNYLGINTEED